MLKVVCTGPESSGKTTLAVQLAQHFDCPWVVEYARDYLHQLHRPYVESDLLDIAKGQWAQEHSSSPPLLICDTDLLTIAIWSEVKYGRIHPWIESRLSPAPRCCYFLCSPDIPWEDDPLRENPHDRDALFQRYFDRLTELDSPFVILSGGQEARRQQAIQAIEHWQASQ
ncbi:MAG: ATP-binding protein [Bacteroidota bacterium]